MMKLIVDENLLSFKVLEQKVCDKCSLPVPLYSSNSHETQSLFAELLEYKKVPTTLDTN